MFQRYWKHTRAPYVETTIGLLMTVQGHQYYEVDFVCNQGSKRYYIQSAYKMINEDKVKQEEASLRRIDDSFKKIIVLGEYTPVLHNESGITFISIYDFLLKENSLEL